MRDFRRNTLRHVFATLLAIAIGLVVCALLSGCKTTEVVREVPVVVEHTTTQHHTDIVRDTLLMRDSVYHYVQGDTVIIERWHHVIDVNRMVVTDTVRDTIPKVVEVTKTERVEVAAPLRWWQKSLMWLGGILAALACCCAGWIIWRVRA